MARRRRRRYDQAVEPAGRLISVGAENDPAVVLSIVPAVDVVNVHPRLDDVLGRAEIVEEDVHAAPDPGRRALVVASRSRTSIHCTLYKRTASCTWPAPSIRGLGPFPYRSITTGAPSPPELAGASCPCQADPLFSRVRSPG